MDTLKKLFFVLVIVAFLLPACVVPTPPPAAPAAARRLTPARRPRASYPFGGPRNEVVPAPRVGRVAWAILVDTCAKAATEGRVDIGWATSRTRSPRRLCPRAGALDPFGDHRSRKLIPGARSLGR
jgi:hypothetical protein